MTSRLHQLGGRTISQLKFARLENSIGTRKEKFIEMVAYRIKLARTEISTRKAKYNMEMEGY
jgi:hypothetical protein